MPMKVVLTPDPGGDATVAIIGALEQEGVDLGRRPSAHGSAWRAASLAEGVESPWSTTVWPGYSAVSPRSTRGAMRA